LPRLNVGPGKLGNRKFREAHAWIQIWGMAFRIRRKGSIMEKVVYPRQPYSIFENIVVLSPMEKGSDED
jgi:hypothetical protein